MASAPLSSVAWFFSITVFSRLRKPEDISAIRVATSEADAVIGGDLVTTAGLSTLSLMHSERTRAIVNGHETITGEFTRDAKFAIPSDRLLLAIEAKIGASKVKFYDFSDLSRNMLGDSIYANVMILGASWQNGMIPLSKTAIHKAITLNGTNIEMNIKAFELGCWVIVDPSVVEKTISHKKPYASISLSEKIDLHCNHIELYQNKKLADRAQQTPLSQKIKTKVKDKKK